MTVDLRAAPPAVLDGVLALNAGAETETSALTPDRLAELIGWSCFARGVVEEGRVSAFLLGFAPGTPYDSPNYRWFATRYPRFAYVDRVVVAPQARGRGLARRLYHDFAAFAAARGLGPLVCEINTDPPNLGSDAFHAALGFAEAGRAQLGPGKAVRYMVRPPVPVPD